MTARERGDVRWLAIYGAAFALQFRDCMKDGGHPAPDDVSRYIDVAETYADLELRRHVPGRCDP